MITFDSRSIQLLLPCFSQKFLSSLSSMNASASSQQYGPVLNCMCSWGKVGQVMDLVKKWVAEGINGLARGSPQRPPVSPNVKRECSETSFQWPRRDGLFTPTKGSGLETSLKLSTTFLRCHNLPFTCHCINYAPTQPILVYSLVPFQVSIYYLWMFFFTRYEIKGIIRQTVPWECTHQ